MKLTGMGSVLAAAFLISLNGASAAEHPKVNANGTATEESTATEAGGDEAVRQVNYIAFGNRPGKEQL
jgi:hypothetical protein